MIVYACEKGLEISSPPNITLTTPPAVAVGGRVVASPPHPYFFLSRKTGRLSCLPVPGLAGEILLSVCYKGTLETPSSPSTLPAVGAGACHQSLLSFHEYFAGLVGPLGDDGFCKTPLVLGRVGYPSFAPLLLVGAGWMAGPVSRVGFLSP